jgi:hypothetical protein
MGSATGAVALRQQRVPLRGLMFSLPENKPTTSPEGTADAEQYIPRASVMPDAAGHLAGDR